MNRYITVSLNKVKKNKKNTQQRVFVNSAFGTKVDNILINSLRKNQNTYNSTATDGYK